MYNTNNNANANGVCHPQQQRGPDPSPFTVVHHQQQQQQPTEDRDSAASPSSFASASNNLSELSLPKETNSVSSKGKCEDYSFPVRLHYLLSVLQDDNLAHYA